MYGAFQLKKIVNEMEYSLLGAEMLIGTGIRPRLISGEINGTEMISARGADSGESDGLDYLDLP